MTSGIYKLTFPSGRYYVGKSISIEDRMQQHADNFENNKASQAMQAEYNRYGMPTAKVLFKCHADHIDVVEPIFIQALRSNEMLNSAYTRVDNVDLAYSVINANEVLLQESMLSHIALIKGQAMDIAMLEEAVQEAEYTVAKYKNEGYIIDEDYETVVNEAYAYKLELQRLKELSWWERLFNYKVYV